MYWRYTYYTIIILITWLLQTGFVSALPYPFNHLNLIFVILIFLLLFDDLNLLYYWAIISTLLLSLSSRLPLAILLISWWSAILICYLILHKFLTNRSLYSLILLVSGGTILLEFFVLFGTHLYKLFTGIILFEPLNQLYFLNLSHTLILNVITILTLFYIMNAINSKLKPFLLLKTRK